MNPVFGHLKQRFGVEFMGQPHMELQKLDAFGGVAMDAQPQMVTVSNAGIPAFLSTYLDPKFIDILVAPMKAAEIVGSEVKKGDWVTKTAMFPVAESTGEVSSYGDYSENGVANVNVNYVNRQSYHYQVITQWGEMELATAGLGHIDLANRLNIASLLTLNKYQNKTYFFGVKGLENYGLLNDPNLFPAITPSVKASGGVAWSDAASPTEVYNDVVRLFGKLVAQANGLVDKDTPMTLIMSPESEAIGLTKTNNFNVNVTDQLKKNFTNLKVKTAPEYGTASGNFVQLIADEVEGQRTAECGFTEKLRAHAIVTRTSSWAQKKSQGTWGTIIFRPFLIVSMLGV